MEKEILGPQINSLPDGTEIFVKYGIDDAYPCKLRLFKEGNKVVAYIDADKTRMNEHRNFPEGYTGVTEIVDLPVKKKETPVVMSEQYVG